MDIQTEDKNSVDWEEVILRLQSYTRSLVSKKGWYRISSVVKKDPKNDGENKYESTYIKGKEVDDYVYEAIEKYLVNKEKHDPQKGSLLDYLKYGVIRSLVSNDLVSSENRTSKDVLAHSNNLEDDENDNGSYLDSILPYVDAYFDMEIDYKEIMNYVQGEIKGDEILEEIFLGICLNGLKRRDVIEEFNISEKDFDNGMRRLKTILSRTAKKFDLKTQSL
jgi:hypothetical protein